MKLNTESYTYYVIRSVHRYFWVPYNHRSARRSNNNSTRSTKIRGSFRVVYKAKV